MHHLFSYSLVTFTSGRSNKVTVAPCSLFASLVAIPAPARTDPLATSRVLAINIRTGNLDLAGRLAGYPLPSPVSAKGLGTSAW